MEVLVSCSTVKETGPGISSGYICTFVLDYDYLYVADRCGFESQKWTD